MLHTIIKWFTIKLFEEWVNDARLNLHVQYRAIMKATL